MHLFATKEKDIFLWLRMWAVIGDKGVEAGPLCLAWFNAMIVQSL